MYCDGQVFFESDVSRKLGIVEVSPSLIIIIQLRLRITARDSPWLTARNPKAAMYDDRQ